MFTPPLLLVATNWVSPPVTHTAPLAPGPLPRVSTADRRLVPPAIVKVPCEELPTITFAASQVPFDTAIWPTPLPPTLVLALVITSCAVLPVIQTAPVTLALAPMVRALNKRFVPPSIVSVPCEPMPWATFTARASHVPLETVI